MLQSKKGETKQQKQLKQLKQQNKSSDIYAGMAKCGGLNNLVKGYSKKMRLKVG